MAQGEAWVDRDVQKPQEDVGEHSHCPRKPQKSDQVFKEAASVETQSQQVGQLDQNEGCSSSPTSCEQGFSKTQERWPTWSEPRWQSVPKDHQHRSSIRQKAKPCFSVEHRRWAQLQRRQLGELPNRNSHSSQNCKSQHSTGSWQSGNGWRWPRHSPQPFLQPHSSNQPARWLVFSFWIPSEFRLGWHYPERRQLKPCKHPEKHGDI